MTLHTCRTLGSATLEMRDIFTAEVLQLLANREVTTRFFDRLVYIILCLITN